MPKKPARKKSSRLKPHASGLPRVEYPDYDATFRPEDAIVAEGPEVLQPSRLAYRDDARGLYLYHGDCLEVMDTLLAKYPQGVFDKRIFLLWCFELDGQPTSPEVLSRCLPK